MNSINTHPRYKTSSRLLFLCVTLFAVGCGGNKGGTIKGQVTTSDGKRVTAGTLVFAPVPQTTDDQNPGTPTSVTIQPDGTFSAKTSTTGPLRVVYTSPGPEYPPGYTPMSSEPAPESPFTGLTLRQNEFEISKGENTLTIELVRPTP